ncbi:glycine betaine ABC transporter substrate-binding protein [Caballeronia sp. DA-9]|uniref:glycine betaine ABC transporter substrate-binding protein n=1 Tax=Caballeronia sp. DA-9 TaxID=3436237 RepID=UPI003F669722
MKANLIRIIGKLGIVMTLSAISLSGGAAEPLKIGTPSWIDDLTLTNVAKYVLETKLNQPVEIVQADIGIVFQGVARGDLDVFLGAWLPLTHGTYVSKYKNDLVDAGIVFSGAQNGWVVPSYIPENELSSISDLNKPEVKSKLNATIQGIEPGSGIMQASEKALKDYNLVGYNLQSSSEAGALATITRAEQTKSWTVITFWTPHWIWKKLDMRFLKDPKGSLGGQEQAHIMESKQLATKFPRANVFLQHFKLSLADIAAVEEEGSQTKDFATAAKHFVDAHPEKVKAWLQQ